MVKRGVHCQSDIQHEVEASTTRSVESHLREAVAHGKRVSRSIIVQYYCVRATAIRSLLFFQSALGTATVNRHHRSSVEVSVKLNDRRSAIGDSIMMVPVVGVDGSGVEGLPR
jgi:hypothetical protein